jgi:DNA repair exonuclease SbcCD ATPase subunit
MLTDQCTAAQSLAKRLNEARELKNQAKGIKQRLEQLRALQKRFSDLTTALTELRKHKVHVAEKEAPSAALVQNVADMYDIATKSPTQFVDSPKVTEFVTDRGPDYLQRLERNLKKVWAQHIDKIAPTTNEQFLSVLSKINAFSATVKKIEKFQTSLKSRRDTLPTDSQDFDELKDIVAELAAAWQRIGGDKVPPAVREFLSRAVSPLGASLSEYDEEVSSWLEDHNIADQFVIRNRITQ